MNPAHPTLLSLAQLLQEQQPHSARFDRTGTVAAARILFVGGEPKVGKSLLVANLALGLAAGIPAGGFAIPTPRRVLVCQFELPLEQVVSRLSLMRPRFATAADQRLWVDTRAAGHLLSAPQGLNHFIAAAQAAAAEVIVLDPLYSAHDQDENDMLLTQGPAACLSRSDEERCRKFLFVIHWLISCTRRAFYPNR
jgi:hypothetical protein